MLVNLYSFARKSISFLPIYSEWISQKSRKVTTKNRMQQLFSRNYCKNHTYSLLIADSSECAFISREKKAIFVVKLEKNDNRHKTEDYESA